MKERSLNLEWWIATTDRRMKHLSLNYSSAKIDETKTKCKKICTIESAMVWKIKQKSWEKYESVRHWMDVLKQCV